jgi:hypothetical protein
MDNVHHKRNLSLANKTMNENSQKPIHYEHKDRPTTQQSLVVMYMVFPIMAIPFGTDPGEP